MVAYQSNPPRRPRQESSAMERDALRLNLHYRNRA